MPQGTIEMDVKANTEITINSKPGYKTTEFWLTIFTSAIGLLVLGGVINQDEADQWQAVLLPLLTALLPQIMYVWSRTQVKKADSKIILDAYEDETE